MTHLDSADVLRFWFEVLTPKDWFIKNEKTDSLIRERFHSTLQSALRGELFSWRKSEVGRLAEILVLDQFSRNIYRGRAEAFQGDPIALVLAQEAVFQNSDQKVEIGKRHFFYMPFMHSESKLVHDMALPYFSQPGLEDTFKYEILHKKIIDRFGRFPHRNQILGRTSTAEEIEFLKGPNSSF